MKEVLVATGTCRTPGEVIAERIERTLVEAIKNATTEQEVTRLERYLAMGLLPNDMMNQIEAEQRIADQALVLPTGAASMKKGQRRNRSQWWPCCRGFRRRCWDQ